MLKHFFLTLSFLCLTPLLSTAQVTDATLKLSVSDTQNNSVSGSAVEIINEETGVRRTRRHRQPRPSYRCRLALRQFRVHEPLHGWIATTFGR